MTTKNANTPITPTHLIGSTGPSDADNVGRATVAQVADLIAPHLPAPSVEVDGVTITGDGTEGDPLSIPATLTKEVGEASWQISTQGLTTTTEEGGQLSVTTEGIQCLSNVSQLALGSVLGSVSFQGQDIFGGQVLAGAEGF